MVSYRSGEEGEVAMTDEELRKRLSRVQGDLMKCVAVLESIKLMLPERRVKK